MDKTSEHVLVIQKGSAKPEVHHSQNEKGCHELVRKLAPELTAKLEVVERRISTLHTEVLKDPDLLIEYYQLVSAQGHEAERINQMLEGLSSDEQIAKIEQYHRYSSIGSAIYWANRGHSGSARWVGAWPNFNWWPFSFNDRASSAVAWGFHVAFEHSWWRGRRLYLIGLPYVSFDDLSVFGFDNLISSAAG
jgi:hypothetical protein